MGDVLYYHHYVSFDDDILCAYDFGYPRCSLYLVYILSEIFCILLLVYVHFWRVILLGLLALDRVDLFWKVQTYEMHKKSTQREWAYGDYDS